jgi:hypothetical protein
MTLLILINIWCFIFLSASLSLSLAKLIHPCQIFKLMASIFYYLPLFHPFLINSRRHCRVLSFFI